MCHTCKKLEGKDDLGTEKLRAEHALKCKMNYSGSAPAMEPECAKHTFSKKNKKKDPQRPGKRQGTKTRKRKRKPMQLVYFKLSSWLLKIVSQYYIYKCLKLSFLKLSIHKLPKTLLGLLFIQFR